MKTPTILIAEEETGQCQKLKESLRCYKCDVIGGVDAADVVRRCPNADLILVILGSSRTGAQGTLSLARKVRELNGKVPIILITAHSSEELAIAALKIGINDYLREPLSVQELLEAVEQRIGGPSIERESVAQGTNPPGLIEGSCMVGESPQICQLRAYIQKVAPTESTVLITGETGTGKELVAELIHTNSLRCHKPFVCLNCAAIPDSLLESELFGHEKGAFTGANSSQEGKLKLAHGGTVFFDEIGDMSSYAQAKILRILEGKELYRLGGQSSIPLNIRIIAATNQDLDQMAEEGKFRKDVFFRLNVARIDLPPLRKRKEDIPQLFDYYVRRLNGTFGQQVEGIEEETLKHLVRYDWPGNVREFKNLLEAIFVNLPSPRISLMDFPERFRARLADAQSIAPHERDDLLLALYSTNWNKSRAAERLHWSRMTLYRKIAKYHLVRKGGKTPEIVTPIA